MTKKSLSAFCKEFDLAKSSVHRWCQSEGIDTSTGITPEECDRILAKFCLELSSQSADSASSKLATITIDAGNHTSAITPPDLPSTFSLEGLRTMESVYFEDPLAVAERFLAAADQIGEALDSDLEARRKRLQQTQRAKEQIADKAQELKVKQRIYREEALVNDSALNRETSALQDALEILQRLGKDESK